MRCPILFRSLISAVSFFCLMASDQVAGIAPLQAAEVPSFTNDVQPILTRYNCNSGGCHGKLAGQNGFRLSLRGYAPEDDHKSLEQAELGRRINLLAPEQSLILQKATGKVSHGGGQLFESDSLPYKTLTAWIENGAPGLREDEPRVTEIATSPTNVTLTPGDRQRLEVRATYSDGSQRDVTSLAQFHSNDTAFATVSPEGQLAAERHGEVSIVVSFQGLVDTVVLTMPYEHQIDPEDFAARSNFIDDHVMEKLRSLRIRPSQLCDDTTYLRRVMLDLIGTLPAPEEVQQFLADQSSDKRERLVDRLLDRPEFVDYWTLQLGDLLQNRKERDHDVRGVKGVRGMHAWLRRQVAENRPWNELAHQVLTASGPSDTNPAVGYFVVTVGEKEAKDSEVADSVAQAFLGTRIGCAKCHNHPLEKYTQDDYYHFIAFFSQVSLDRKPPTQGPTVLKQGTRHLRNLEKRLQNEEQELQKLREEKAEDRQIEKKVQRLKQLRDEIRSAREAPPTVNQPRTGQPLPPQTLDRAAMEIPPGVDPRVSLAEWMTSPENKAFAGSMVNRLWKHFFAVGLVEPVDDLRDTNPPSNGPLFEALIAELIDSNYDLRHVMKRIVTSRTYQLDSATLPQNATDSRFYSHYYAKRLPGEVLLDALVQATGVPETFPGYPHGTRAAQLPGPQIDSYFLTTFGRSERVTACACERSGEVTLSQLLHLQNSENLLSKVRAPQGNLARWVETTESPDELIEQLFLATYSRPPSDADREFLRQQFDDADRMEVASDLFWALLNAKEFTFNH